MKLKNYYRNFLLLLLVLCAGIFIQGCSDNDSDDSRFAGLENRPKLGSSASGPHTHNNAVGVYWNKKLWLFYSTEDDSNNEIHYTKFDGGSVPDGSTIIQMNGSPVYSKALTNPIVVKNILYLFYTGTNGKLYYIYLDPADSKWKNIRISDSIIIGSGTRYAAVFNTLRSCFEIYWVPENSSDVYYSRLNVNSGGYPEGSWQSSAKVLSGSASGSPHLNAVYSQTGDSSGLTYLAWVDSSRYSKVSHIQFDDAGTLHILKTDSIFTALSSSTNDGISLVDLGEDQMAMINVTPSHRYISLEYYDKKQDKWSSAGNIDAGSTNNWMPTGAVYYQPTADSSAYPDGNGSKNRYDAIFYVMNGEWDNNLQLRSTWKIRSVDHVGYWKPVSATTTDTRDYLYSPLWPVLGVVDAPPYVMNGVNMEDWCISGSDCTKTEFEVAVTNQQVIGGSVKGGAYMETGKHSPITFELSAGLSGAYETGTSFTYTQTDEIEETAESKGFIYYLAPKLVNYQLEWYDRNGNASGTYTYYVTIPESSVLKRFFTVAEGAEGYDNPAQSFIGLPNHQQENDYDRLLTYYYTGTSTDPSTFTGLFDKTQIFTWGGGSPASPSWTVSSDTSVSKGAYVELKIGKEFKDIIGVGVEGSFEIQTTSTVSKDVTVQMRFVNPEAKQTGDVTQFDIIAYWLKPDANAYWIPTDRKGLGDTPFLITYSVNKNTIGVKK